jgi:hypothetical protein
MCICKRDRPNDKKLAEAVNKILKVLINHEKLNNLNLKSKDIRMAQAMDPKELVEFREMVMVNTIQVDTMYQLLVQKGYFTEAEFLGKMKEVQADYQNSRRH